MRRKTTEDLQSMPKLPFTTTKPSRTSDQSICQYVQAHGPKVNISSQITTTNYNCVKSKFSFEIAKYANKLIIMQCANALYLKPLIKE